MKNITTVIDLKNAIQLLEAEQANELMLLKEQAYNTYENLKPVNIIKNSINGLITTPDLKENIIGTTLSIAAGYLSKKVAIGTTHNPVTQLLGTLLQIGVTSIVSKNTAGIKMVAARLINIFFNKKHNSN
jgi:hypothetical protein